METIHLKTVDPLSQELLKSACQRGIQLSWDRYEKLQPQDGFLRLGLSCPFGCMQGPCRIDPFGRGADRGVCGLDRDRMAAALLLRMTLNGALEGMSETGSSAVPALPPASPLGKLSRGALKACGGKNLSGEDLAISASFLSRPAESADSLIRQALRLGILTVGVLASKKGEASRNMKVGYGILREGTGAAVAACGNLPASPLEKFRQKISKKFPGGAALVSLGDWIPSGAGYIPSACTSGEAELALCSGKIQMVITGPGAAPAIADTCRSLNIPCVSPLDPEKAVSPKMDFGSAGISFAPDARLQEEAPVFLTPLVWERSLRKNLPANGSSSEARTTLSFLWGGWPRKSEPHYRAGKPASPPGGTRPSG